MQSEKRFEGQSFPMFFKYKNEGAHVIVDIAHTSDVIGLEFKLFRLKNNLVRVIEILEKRDTVNTGINYFHPDARFYKVKYVVAN